MAARSPSFALALGMNSGSSFDGIDAVVVELQLATDGHPRPPRFVGGASYDWPEAVRAQVLAAFNNELTMFELTRLHYVVGAVYADTARKLLDAQKLGPDNVEVIGVDGQTIYQEPPEQERYSEIAERDVVARWLRGPYPCGLQIGEPAVIAEHCGIPVVWNFRPSDHAVGGTGAPLMQYLDFVAFRDIGPVLTLNIGGIANCQLACRDRSAMMAFDTGPGNVMIDQAMRIMFDEAYDAGGLTAARGEIIPELLRELQGHPFFARRPPRSAWRLDFGGTFTAGIIERQTTRRGEDVVATFTAFTAWSIAESIRSYVPGIEDISTVIVSGGGSKNDTLLRMLKESMPRGLNIRSSDEFGIPAQYKEAVKFATLAFATQRRLANNIPSASGASRYAVLGKTVLPPSAALLTE